MTKLKEHSRGICWVVGLEEVLRFFGDIVMHCEAGVMAADVEFNGKYFCQQSFTFLWTPFIMLQVISHHNFFEIVTFLWTPSTPVRLLSLSVRMSRPPFVEKLFLIKQAMTLNNDNDVDYCHLSPGRRSPVKGRTSSFKVLRTSRLASHTSNLDGKCSKSSPQLYIEIWSECKMFTR